MSLSRPKRRLWRRVLLISVGGVMLTLAALGAAVTCRPAWYQPASIDYARLDEDKRELTRLLDDVSHSLNAGRSVEVVLSQDQVNRWIAARAELPDLPGPRTPHAPLQQPYVDFLADRLRVGISLNRGGFPLVVSATLRLSATGDVVSAALDSIRVGALPAPQAAIAQAIDRLLADASSVGRGDAADICVPNDFTWQNGKLRFRLRQIALTQAQLRLTLEPY